MFTLSECSAMASALFVGGYLVAYCQWRLPGLVMNWRWRRLAAELVGVLVLLTLFGVALIDQLDTVLLIGAYPVHLPDPAYLGFWK